MRLGSDRTARKRTDEPLPDSDLGMFHGSLQSRSLHIKRKVAPTVRRSDFERFRNAYRETVAFLNAANPFLSSVRRARAVALIVMNFPFSGSQTRFFWRF